MAGTCRAIVLLSLRRLRVFLRTAPTGERTRLLIGLSLLQPARSLDHALLYDRWNETTTRDVQ